MPLFQPREKLRTLPFLAHSQIFQAQRAFGVSSMVELGTSFNWGLSLLSFLQVVLFWADAFFVWLGTVRMWVLLPKTGLRSSLSGTKMASDLILLDLPMQAEAAHRQTLQNLLASLKEELQRRFLWDSFRIAPLRRAGNAPAESDVEKHVGSVDRYKRRIGLDCWIGLGC